MPIHIDRVTEGEYTAAVTPSRQRNVEWETGAPMATQALIDALVELGYHLQDIADALDEADARWGGDDA
jgi:Holliday junction resolvasome RuvABC DNA-binding subunit